MGAVNNSIASSYVLGQANLVFPEYTIQRWNTVLVAWAVGLFALAVNVFMPHALHRLSRLVLLWNIGTFIVVIVTLLATNDHKQDDTFVFYEFENLTGFTVGMAIAIGIVQSIFGTCCYDAPCRMAEEMTHPVEMLRKSIILSVVLGAVTGLCFLLTLCFCIGDIKGTAESSTSVPIIQIFYDSTRNTAATCILASMITVITIVTSVSSLAEGSRSVFAFARGYGLPFSRVWSKVQSKQKIPLYALALTLAVQLGLNAIYFGTVTGFCSCCLQASPLNFPSEARVTSQSMNYTSAAIGLVALLSIVTWFTSAAKDFTGPSDVSTIAEAECT